MNNRKGFTLIELLAVMAVLGVIMIIAIPSVLETLEAAKEKNFRQMADKISISMTGELALTKYEMKEPDDAAVHTYIYLWDIDELINENNGVKGFVMVESINRNGGTQRLASYLLQNDEYMYIRHTYEDDSTEETFGQVDEVSEAYARCPKEYLYNKKSYYELYKLMSVEQANKYLYDGPTGKKLYTLYE